MNPTGLNFKSDCPVVLIGDEGPSMGTDAKMTDGSAIWIRDTSWTGNSYGTMKDTKFTHSYLDPHTPAQLASRRVPDAAGPDPVVRDQRPSREPLLGCQRHNRGQWNETFPRFIPPDALLWLFSS